MWMTAAVALSTSSVIGADSRPNIIVVLADDMGFSDIGCYGGEIQTPNLDALADGGLRYSQFYNTARCCPTRASLLTGLYPHQTGLGWMVSKDHGVPGYQGSIGDQCVTIAEVLKASGYSTYMAGKWHVTPIATQDRWPRQRGFDRFYGTIHGAGSFFDPNTLTRENEFVSPDSDPDYRPEEPFYYTDAISDHACRYISDHDADEPFFMYVAYTAAHWPMHARPRDIKKYAGRYDSGYEPIRKARWERVKELGLVNPEGSVAPQVGDWAEVPNPEWESRCMEVYAAMVDNMDQGIGRIVASLESKGVRDNTLILYMQDNGGCAEKLGRGGKGRRAESATLPPMPKQELLRDMVPKQTRDG
ncbi:MAG: sulfatase-like hydrolase/transferase, partial [Planctomycetota bacterium]